MDRNRRNVASMIATALVVVGAPSITGITVTEKTASANSAASGASVLTSGTPAGAPPGGTSRPRYAATGVYTLSSGTRREHDQSYSSSVDDRSGVLVTDGATRVLDNPTVKTSGDSNVTALSGVEVRGTTVTNIKGNGHTVTYDASTTANEALDGKTYKLAGGGTLKPA